MIADIYCLVKNFYLLISTVFEVIIYLSYFVTYNGYAPNSGNSFKPSLIFVIIISNKKGFAQSEQSLFAYFEFDFRNQICWVGNYIPIPIPPIPPGIPPPIP